MPRAPTTDRAEVVVATGESEYDDVLGVYTLFLVVPRVESVYFRLVVESWEDFAVARTMQRFYPGDRTRSLVVVMAVPDFIEPCAKSLARLCAEIDGVPVPTTAELREALRRDLLDPQPPDGTIA